MSLLIAPLNKNLIVQKMFFDEKIKRHLYNLGIITGAQIEIIGKSCGNLIVKIKNARVALNEDLARKIIVM